MKRLSTGKVNFRQMSKPTVCFVVGPDVFSPTPPGTGRTERNLVSPGLLRTVPRRRRICWTDCWVHSYGNSDFLREGAPNDAHRSLPPAEGARSAGRREAGQYKEQNEQHRQRREAARKTSLKLARLRRADQLSGQRWACSWSLTPMSYSGRL